jgi:hypothetical protein
VSGVILKSHLKVSKLHRKKSLLKLNRKRLKSLSQFNHRSGWSRHITRTLIWQSLKRLLIVQMPHDYMNSFRFLHLSSISTMQGTFSIKMVLEASTANSKIQTHENASCIQLFTILFRCKFPKRIKKLRRWASSSKNMNRSFWDWEVLSHWSNHSMDLWRLHHNKIRRLCSLKWRNQ